MLNTNTQLPGEITGDCVTLSTKIVNITENITIHFSLTQKNETRSTMRVLEKRHAEMRRFGMAFKVHPVFLSMNS